MEREDQRDRFKLEPIDKIQLLIHEDDGDEILARIVEGRLEIVMRPEKLTSMAESCWSARESWEDRFGAAAKTAEGKESPPSS
jgi:hypothetical protein